MEPSLSTLCFAHKAGSTEYPSSSGEPAPALAAVAHHNARWRLELVVGRGSQGMLPINPYSPALRRTLSDLARERLSLLAVCRRCKHRGVIYTAALVEQLGPDFPAVRVRERVRCTACKRSRSAVIQKVGRGN